MFRLGSIPPFGCLPVSLVEAPDNHHAPAALEKINFNLSQFSDGDDIDPISASLLAAGTIDRRSGHFLRVV